MVKLGYLEEGHTINCAYYAELRQLVHEIVKKKKKRKVDSWCMDLAK